MMQPRPETLFSAPFWHLEKEHHIPILFLSGAVKPVPFSCHKRSPGVLAQFPACLLTKNTSPLSLLIAFSYYTESNPAEVWTVEPTAAAENTRISVGRAGWIVIQTYVIVNPPHVCLLQPIRGNSPGVTP